MADEHEIEVYRAFREAQTKYTYFLLAAAGAAIGLAVNQTQNSLLTKLQIPLGAAVLSWGLSLYFGCQNLRYVASNLFANLSLIRVRAGKHPNAGTNPAVIAAASDGIQDAIEANSGLATRFAEWQFWMLIFGGVCYVAWHVLQMYARTVSKPPAC